MSHFAAFSALTGRLLLTCVLLAVTGTSVFAQTTREAAVPPPPPAAAAREALLAAGDIVTITVYQSPDLTTEARISENGTISFPLLGTVRIAGLTPTAAESLLARLLVERNLVKAPYVRVSSRQSRDRQVTIYGFVQRPGVYTMETTTGRLSELLAQAGGLQPEGADVLVLSGTREGQPFRREVLLDMAAARARDNAADEVPVQGGDTIYVPRAAMYFVQGEAVRPGAYRLLRDMTVLQGIAQAGGKSGRGSLTRLSIIRKSDRDSVPAEIVPSLSDRILDGDVITIKESLF